MARETKAEQVALTGVLTDEIPDFMSEVIGRWIIQVQDFMPDDFRNSQQWKSLLPLAAGTGRERERERLAVIMDWMWGKVLPTLQPVADRGGFGDEWLAMTTHRTDAAANVAGSVAASVAKAAVDAAEAWAASYAASYAAWAANAADAASWRLAAKRADAAAAAAATHAARAVAWVDTDAWITVDPCGLLERLIRVGEQNPST